MPRGIPVKLDVVSSDGSDARIVEEGVHCDESQSPQEVRSFESTQRTRQQGGRTTIAQKDFVGVTIDPNDASTTYDDFEGLPFLVAPPRFVFLFYKKGAETHVDAAELARPIFQR